LFSLNGQVSGKSVMLASYETESPQDQERRSNCIRAELTGSDTATALGIVAHGSNPIIQLCRLLTSSGIDPATPLEAWRGTTLALTVRCIGEAAELRVNPRGTGFLKAISAVPTASPIDSPPLSGPAP
jgi:hypothetical protein